METPDTPQDEAGEERAGSTPDEEATDWSWIEEPPTPLGPDGPEAPGSPEEQPSDVPEEQSLGSPEGPSTDHLSLIEEDVPPELWEVAESGPRDWMTVEPPPAAARTSVEPMPRRESEPVRTEGEPIGLPPLDEVVFTPRGSTRTDSRPESGGGPHNLSRKRFAAIARLADALLPAGGAVAVSAADVGVAERIDASMAQMDSGSRRALEALITYWDWAPLLSRTPRHFRKLSPAAATRFTERALKSHNPALRQAAIVLKTICGNEYASTAAVEQSLGFTYSCVTSDPPQETVPLEVISYPGVDRDHVEECDVVIVGSGAGGAVVAKELAEAGLSVIVLEEGDNFTRTDFAGPPWERMRRLYRANGSTMAFGVPTIPLPLGKGVGGTTLVNSGTCFRTPDRVLEQWGSERGIEGIDPASMRPYFDRVERILHVQPVPEDLLGNNARLFRRGVRAMGLHGAPLLRNIDGCRACGVCAYGCPSDAKQSTHISYLPRAQRAGATIYARCRVERIVVSDGRARGVIGALTNERGEPKAKLEVRSKIVVLAAGAIHTPALLEANSLANRSGQLGRNLRIHPAAAVAAWFDEEVFAWRGTPQSFFVDDWQASHDIMIEVTATLPSVAAGGMPGVGLPFKEVIGQFPHMATAGLFVSDTSTGRVHRRRHAEPFVTYRLNRVDTRKLVRGIVNASEVFLAAGARRVWPPLPGVGFVTQPSELEQILEKAVRPGALRLMAFHPVGTARMGADPSSCVVDQWHECHGVPGLFVADAGVLPSCPTVNPMVTIMAFATRCAAVILREKSAYFA